IEILDKDGNPAISRGLMPKYYDIDEVYNRLLKAVSSKGDPVVSYDYMLNVLRELAKEDRLIEEVVNKLEAGDQQLKNQFVVNLSLHSLNSRFVMYNYDKEGKRLFLQYYNTNSNSTVIDLKAQWKNSLFNIGM
ncbi:hypothetical protein RZS08_17915, partial [Arthrospira platensis SPKY1]|nr:hypothetical protein [Arthrospira platensis SPKY1]